MKPQDPWYVRLPDDRIVKAKSTHSVRHHVEAGNIPLNSMARRDAHADWVSLIRITEFSDLAGQRSRIDEPIGALPPIASGNGSSPESDIRASVSARLDPMRLQTVGVRGLVDELIAAFDSTISASKLVTACVACTIGSLVVFLTRLGLLSAHSEGIWLAEIVGGIIAGAFLALVVAVLTQQTHLELSRMRPVYLAEAAKGIKPFAFRIFIGYAATAGLCIGLIVLLQEIPDWLKKPLRSQGAGVDEVLSTGLRSVSQLMAVILFAVMFLSLLLPPILIVEECSVGDAIREWRSLIREHRLRVFVYEGLAFALACVAALPAAIPVLLALRYFPPLGDNWLSAAVPSMLYGFLLGPAVAFLAVANLFVYLNLRYEYSPNR